MSNISQFFAGSRKKNRRIIHGGVGVTTITWLVPPGVTEVEVHCWGAGGKGSPGGAGAGGGGGGGGYVTHVFPVTPSDRLLITAGAEPGGTSSVSVPTQSPISPISATGGSAGQAFPPAGAGGSGGVGSYTIAPGISTARTFSASGGAGGSMVNPADLGAGGAAGSPFGTGGAGQSGAASSGGGGIGGDGRSGSGGGALGVGIGTFGGLGKNGYRATSGVGGNPSGDDWFYVDEILGSGGDRISINGGAGAGGGTSGNGGILGGGGSNGVGGLAGGGGAGSPARAGAGLVILYW